MSFHDPLRVELVEGPDGHPDLREGRPQWRTLDRVRYEVGTLGSGDVISVPPGFVTDFASVPQFFWAFEPPGGPATKAAVVHDYLYKTRARTRAECDGIFREALGVVGVASWKRAILWASVRAGGWTGWGR